MAALANDIAVLKLVRDVTFTGTIKNLKCFFYIKFRIISVNNFHLQLYFFNLFLERIVPICLPDNGAILTKSFVGQNPFVAG